MGILKRGNSKFWYIQFQYNGQTYIKSTKTTDRRLADMMESDWRKKLIVQQVVGIKDRISIHEMLSEYGKSKSDLLSYKNLIFYIKMVKKLFKETEYVDTITTQTLEHIKQSYKNQGYSNQTIKHLFSTIRGAWKHAKRLGYQVTDVEFPKMKVDKVRLRYLSFEEEKRLLIAIDPRREVKGLAVYEERHQLLKNEMQDMYDFLIMLLDTGARHGEIRGLEWTKINLEDKTISLWRPKVRNESIIYMTDRVFDILSRRKIESKSEYVFINRSGGPKGYCPAGMRKAFDRAGIHDCSAHTLRHTHASRLIQNGLNIYEVKEILGHSDIRTTMRYAHIEQRSVSIKAREVINNLNITNI